MSHVKSNGTDADAKTGRQIADAAERVGDGKHLTPADFKLLNLAERTALHQSNRDAYDALVAGRAPGARWSPTTHGATRNKIAQSDQ